MAVDPFDSEFVFGDRSDEEKGLGSIPEALAAGPDKTGPDIPMNISGSAAGATLGLAIGSGAQVIAGRVYIDGEDVGPVNEVVQNSTSFRSIDDVVTGDPTPVFPGISIPGSGPDWALPGTTISELTGIGGFAGAPYAPGYVQPYTLGQEDTLFRDLGSDQIAEIQLMFVEQGLVDITDFTYGDWDDLSKQLMLQTMSHANKFGVTWEGALANLGETVRQERARSGGGGGGGGARGFTAPVYRPPDYAALTQSVKQTMQARLGRDPQDWELELLADRMKEDFRVAFDADVQAARQQHEAALAGRASSGAPVESVDPGARMVEYFEEQYKPELDRIVAVGDATTNRSLLMQSILGGDALNRGDTRRNEL